MTRSRLVPGTARSGAEPLSGPACQVGAAYTDQGLPSAMGVGVAWIPAGDSGDGAFRPSCDPTLSRTLIAFAKRTFGRHDSEHDRGLGGAHSLPRGPRPVRRPPGPAGRPFRRGVPGRVLAHRPGPSERPRGRDLPDTGRLPLGRDQRRPRPLRRRPVPRFRAREHAGAPQRAVRADLRRSRRRPLDPHDGRQRDEAARRPVHHPRKGRRHRVRLRVQFRPGQRREGLARHERRAPPVGRREVPPHRPGPGVAAHARFAPVGGRRGLALGLRGGWHGGPVARGNLRAAREDRSSPAGPPPGAAPPVAWPRRLRLDHPRFRAADRPHARGRARGARSRAGFPRGPCRKAARNAQRRALARHVGERTEGRAPGRHDRARRQRAAPARAGQRPLRGPRRKRLGRHERGDPPDQAPSLFDARRSRGDHRPAQLGGPRGPPRRHLDRDRVVSLPPAGGPGDAVLGGGRPGRPRGPVPGRGPRREPLGRHHGRAGPPRGGPVRELHRQGRAVEQQRALPVRRSRGEALDRDPRRRPERLRSGPVPLLDGEGGARLELGPVHSRGCGGRPVGRDHGRAEPPAAGLVEELHQRGRPGRRQRHRDSRGRGGRSLDRDVRRWALADQGREARLSHGGRRPAVEHDPPDSSRRPRQPVVLEPQGDLPREPPAP